MAAQAIATVLDFLFAANIEASDAFAIARSFVEAGVTTPDAISNLTPERAKALALPLADKKLHRKLLGAIRKMPTLEEETKRQRCSMATSTPSARRAPPMPLPSEVGTSVVVVNRSPVMILWATAVAHVVLAHDWSEALSLGSACAAIFARSKGASLGLYAASPSCSSAATSVHLLGTAVATSVTPSGLRGLSENKHRPGVLEVVEPAIVFNYLSRA